MSSFIVVLHEDDTCPAGVCVIAMFGPYDTRESLAEGWARVKAEYPDDYPHRISPTEL